MKCGQCGFVRQFPLPTPEALADYYAPQYRADHQGQSASPTPHHIAKRRKEAERRLAILQPLLKPGAAVLGCLHLAHTIGFTRPTLELMAAKHGFAVAVVEDAYDIGMVFRRGQPRDLEEIMADGVPRWRAGIAGPFNGNSGGTPSENSFPAANPRSKFGENRRLSAFCVFPSWPESFIDARGLRGALPAVRDRFVRDGG